MADINFLRRNIRGIRSLFLARDGEILDMDVEVEPEMESVLLCISYIARAFCDKGRCPRTISIIGTRKFFIFLKDPYILGVVASPDINVVVLSVIVRRILDTMEVAPSVNGHI